MNQTAQALANIISEWHGMTQEERKAVVTDLEEIFGSRHQLVKAFNFLADDIHNI